MEPSLGYMRALAFLYDNLASFPVWVQKLAPGQLTQFAKILNDWLTADSPSNRIIPLQEIEKREVIRAVIACQGDLRAAADALGIGKTTIYRLLHKWGLTKADWRLFLQARSLAGGALTTEVHTADSLSEGTAFSSPASFFSPGALPREQNSGMGRSK
jgi:hypothetical protein